MCVGTVRALRSFTNFFVDASCKNPMCHDVVWEKPYHAMHFAFIALFRMPKQTPHVISFIFLGVSPTISMCFLLR